jgi:hypothetical protein
MGPGLRGLRDAVILVLSTSFTMGAVVAVILNTILPRDTPAVAAAADGKELASQSSESFDESLPAVEDVPAKAVSGQEAVSAPTVEVIAEPASKRQDGDNQV